MTRNEYTVDELADVLLRAGFVECNIAACNCGSWHHRYGLPERFSEIKDALMDAGVLNNETGNLPIRAIAKLIEQRDALRSRLAEAERQMSDARVLIAVGDYSSAAARLAPKAADSASVCLHQIHNGDTCEICGAKVTPVVQPERCCVDYPRCDCNSPPEPDNAPALQPCGHPWKAQQDRSQMLMAELTPDATKSMNMRANGERPWSFHDSFDVCRNDRLLLLQHSDALSARLAEAERNEGTLLGMIHHQRDVLRECLPYLNESMAGKGPGRSADDIRAAVKALTSASADGPKGEK